METLALIELLDRDGQARQSLRVTQWPVRIGRAIDCDLVLDDPHVAAHHVDLVQRGDGVHIEPAATVNGVRLGRAAIVGGSAPLLPASAELGVGACTLRVRLASAPLAPEQPLADVHRHERKHAAVLLALVLFAAVWAAFDQWVSSAPGEPAAAVAARYLAAPIGLVIWCALWALGSKLFQHQFAFWPHLHAALLWPLVAVVGETAADQLAFALGMPGIAKLGHLLFMGAVAMLLWQHLSIVLPQRRRTFAWVISAFVLVGAGLDVAERARHQEPLVGRLYLGTISLPGLRVAKAVSADAFVQSAQPLEKALSRWARSSGDDADLPQGEGD